MYCWIHLVCTHSLHAVGVGQSAQMHSTKVVSPFADTAIEFNNVKAWKMT